MRRAFTLLELMVVVAIMAALAAISVSGYRALTKGMQDRSALVAVQTLVDAARQRAEIDRQPMVIYFYDQLLQTHDESAGTDMTGHGIAVAVRPIGRISAIDGNYLCDEFGDLDQVYASENQQSSDASANDSNETAIRFYRMADGNYVDVSPTVAKRPISAVFIMTGETSGDNSSEDDSGEKQILCHAFKKLSGTATFKVGDVYGGEFASVTLPDGYFFGSSAPTQVGVKSIEKMQIDAPDSCSDEAKGAKSVTIYARGAGGIGLDKVGSTTTGGN